MHVHCKFDSDGSMDGLYGWASQDFKQQDCKLL